MPANPADCAIDRRLLCDKGSAQLFLAVAKIPATAVAFIDRAAQEVATGPSALAAATAQNGVQVPGLLAAFCKAGVARTKAL
ncbi:MAG: hypothetical protein ACK47C_13950 [Paracoccaceae bacterium]|jgi:3-carboxy-cis,cis-muconate cycloisomerase